MLGNCDFCDMKETVGDSRPTAPTPQRIREGER